MPTDPLDFDEEYALYRRLPERKASTPPKGKSPLAPRSNAPRISKSASGVHKRRRRHYGL
jgi:hypothetical protein